MGKMRLKCASTVFYSAQRDKLKEHSMEIVIIGLGKTEMNLATRLVR